MLNVPPLSLNEVKIEVTYRCALACIHCSSDATPENHAEISQDNCLNIITQIAKLGAKNIAFSGGEPLLWPHLAVAIEHSKKHDLKATVYTTGNVQNFESILPNLINKGLNRAIFSLFGSTPAIHERITRIFGSYNATINAIKLAKYYGIAPEIHFVPLAMNYNEINLLVQLALELDVHKISVLRFVPQGRGQLLKRQTLNKAQNLELRRDIVRIRGTGFDIRTGSPYNFLMLNKSPRCSSGFDKLIIGPDLRIYPCDAFKQIMAAELVGTDDYSVLNGVDLATCWEKSPFLGAIRNYLTTPFAEPCASCRALDDCLSGCLAQKVIYNSSLIKSPDPMCILR